MQVMKEKRRARERDARRPRGRHPPASSGVVRDPNTSLTYSTLSAAAHVLTSDNNNLLRPDWEEY